MNVATKAVVAAWVMGVAATAAAQSRRVWPQRTDPVTVELVTVRPLADGGCRLDATAHVTPDGGARVLEVVSYEPANAAEMARCTGLVSRAATQWASEVLP